MDELREDRVLDFGVAWLHRVFGNGPGAPVMLAGGAFKSLIHGRPPRDLDLWVVDETGHAAVTRALVERGAIPVRDNPPYQAAFSLDGQLIEVAYPRADRSTPDDVLKHFDIGLSAVGACWDRGRLCATIRPESLESSRRREVLLIWPLWNWKYALFTLERMDRYGRELGFSVRQDQVDRLWNLYESQGAEEKALMIDRYRRVGGGVAAILARAEGRLQGVAT